LKNEKFQLVPIGRVRGDQVANEIIIVAAGFLTENDHPELYWQAIVDSHPRADVLALKWESCTSDAAALSVIAHGVKTVVLGVGGALVGFASASPFGVAKTKAEACGAALAHALMAPYYGNVPVTLVGHSLGARVMMYALKELRR
jgi:hypothetical protein